MILQARIPYDVSTHPNLPGTRPFDMAEWLVVDEAFAGQMARRDALVAERPGVVLAMDAAARPAAVELLDMVLARLGPGYAVGASVTRPDGVTVALDRDDPMRVLARLVQEDLVILEKPPGADEHIITAATLCFPASWTLAEKFMRPLTRIHMPVASYDAGMAARVQRLFDGVQVDRPLWRWNGLRYADPELHQPRLEADRRARPENPRYFRSERQCLVRLPVSRAVVFSIHTYVVAVDGGA